MLAARPSVTLPSMGLVEKLSETEAEEALRVVDRPKAGDRDPVIELLDNAPPEDEPISEEEERAVAEGREALRRGDVFSAEEIEHDLG